MLEVRDLRLVKAIAEHGSLARAARVLGVAQPALTRSLAALEAKLRGPLFERGSRGVIATDLGRAILGEVDDLLDRLARLNRHLMAVRGDQVRDVTVVGGAYVAEAVAMPAAARMLALYPTVRMRMLMVNWADVPRMVTEREASIGLVDLRGFADDASLEIVRLRPQPGIFVTRPGHPLASSPQASLVDIVAHPFIFVGRAPREVQVPIAEAREAARLTGALHPAFPGLIHESPTVSLTALRHCDAVVAITVSLAARALESGEVVALPWRAPWMSISPAVIRLRNRPLGEAEQAFLDLVQSADIEAEREALDWCERLGLSTECG